MGGITPPQRGSSPEVAFSCSFKDYRYICEQGGTSAPWDEITRAKWAGRVEGEGVIPLKAPHQLVPCSCDRCLLMSLLVSVLCYVIICCCFYCCCCVD